MDVIIAEQKGNAGHLGVITLNRQQALNSLNSNMIATMHTALTQWAVDPDIKAVVIQAAPGRAFCAGGDLRLNYELFKARDPSQKHFFRDEYVLNKLIHHYPKPYIALLNGITMGGGVGISIHGSHRIATEHLMFAMPETGIGFFPDVGGTYFLPRLISKMGYYLGLTGARLHSADCVALGLAPYFLASHSLPDFLETLLMTPFSDDAYQSVTNIIAKFQQTVTASPLLVHQQEIEHCFAAKTMEEIVNALQSSTSTFARETITTLQHKSPTSLKVTLAALQQGEQWDFDTCMDQEYRIACHFTEGHDFIEGIRAVIIDKDQQPKWQPATLAEVTDAVVSHYLA